MCGGIESPKDIPETVIQAGAAAAEASILINAARNSEIVCDKVPDEKPNGRTIVMSLLINGLFACPVKSVFNI